MDKDSQISINKGFADLGLSEKSKEKFLSAESFATRFKRCSVLEYTEVSYSNTSRADDKQIFVKY